MSEGGNYHYHSEAEREKERENTPIYSRGEPNSNSQTSLVQPILIDSANKQPAAATAHVYAEDNCQTPSHTHKLEGGKEMERQSTPYPNIDLADIDDDDEELSSHHLLQMGKISCHNNPTSLLRSSRSANELSHSQSMEKPQEGDFNFAPQSNRTSTPYPDEHFYASDDTSEY
mgnify:FL=1